MSVSRILFATALAVSLSSALATVAASAEKPAKADCGWAREGGKLVFLGTCPNESGDTGGPATEAPAAPTLT